MARDPSGRGSIAFRPPTGLGGSARVGLHHGRFARGRIRAGQSPGLSAYRLSNALRRF